MKESYRVLVSSGYGIISMPNLLSFHFLKDRVIAEIKKIKNKGTIDSHYKYTFFKIKSIIEESGFSIIKDTSVDFFPLTVFPLGRLNNLIISFDMKLTKINIPFGAFYFVLVNKKNIDI